MIVIIQCAGRKNPAAGTFRDKTGRPILFVAHPELAWERGGTAYARPDEKPDGEPETDWRQPLRLYNERESESNPLSLLPAYRLYAHEVYRELVDEFGLERVFILSAGWGLIPASFLTPAYDITFTSAAETWQRRRRSEGFKGDLCFFKEAEEETVFLGGKDYLPLLCELLPRRKNRVKAYFIGRRPPKSPCDLAFELFVTSVRTNWHYACARYLIAQHSRQRDRR